jgi:hypothetical protein
MNREVLGRLSARLGRTLLVVLGLVLPFEAPLFRLGFLQITTVELVLYATLFVWLVGVVLGPDLPGRLRRGAAMLRADPLAQAAAFLAVAMFVSAAAAPSHRAAAVKFALRSLSGVLVFFAARSLLVRETVRRVVFAVVLGALLSAVTALIDRASPDSAALWRYFREGSFATLGLSRASGVFGYPTIGAMYWEAAAPLLVVLPFVSDDGSVREHAGVRALLRVALGSALLVAAILASATRSGLAGTALACALLLALHWGSAPGVRRAAVITIAVTLTLGTGSSLFGSLLGQRLIFWQDARWLEVEYRIGETPARVHTRESFAVPVTLHNTGVLPWRRTRPNATHLSYHWECPGGGSRSLTDFEGLRTELPSDVPPGGVVDVVAVARGPDAPGEYRLTWDLVEEDVAWFSERGSPKMGQRLIVEPSREDEATPLGDCPSLAADPLPPPRSELWRAAVVLWRARPLLGVGPDNFRRLYETVLLAPDGRRYTDDRVHANSLYFEMLADLGLSGLVALAWIGFGLASALRSRWRIGCSLGVGIAVAAGTFFVHGALDYFFEFTPLLGLFWLLLGSTAALESQPRAGPRGSTR